MRNYTNLWNDVSLRYDFMILASQKSKNHSV